MTEDSVIQIVDHPEVNLLAVARRTLDDNATRVLTDEILTAAAHKPHLPLVLDMGQVKFAPSVALGALVQVSKSLRLDQRRIALVGIHHRIMDTIRVTRLHEVLEIHPTLDAFLKSTGEEKKN